MSLTGVHWLASLPASVGSRLLLWSDSTVVVGASRKGRSSVFGLLCQLRRLAAISVALDMYVYVNWVPTEKNPADAPSRRFEFDSTLGFPGEGPPSFLASHAVAAVTRRKYVGSVRRLLAYLRGRGWDPRSAAELDEAMVEFFHFLYTDNAGKCRSVAECALSGVHLLAPRLKGHLLEASLCLRGWRRLVPPVPHPPITKEMTVAVAAVLLVRGKWEAAIGVLLAFDCYLRAGELLRLRVCDVSLPGDDRLGSVFAGAGLRLATTKTGQEQFVVVEDPAVVRLLGRLVAARRASDGSEARLFPFPDSSLRRWFKEAAAVLGLPPTVALHSLRHGGATHAHLAGRPLEDILQRGRWASMRSARHYIQMGKALLVAASVPQWALEVAAALAVDVDRVFALAQLHGVGSG